MPAKHPVLINGKNYDWTNIDFVLFGVPVIGITEISYSRDRVSVNNMGAGAEPTSWGNGAFSYTDSSITVYMDEVQAILQTAPGKSILEIPPFPITVIFSGDGVNFATHKLRNCRFTKDPVSVKSGDTAILCKLNFVFAGLDKT